MRRWLVTAVLSAALLASVMAGAARAFEWPRESNMVVRVPEYALRVVRGVHEFVPLRPLSAPTRVLRPYMLPPSYMQMSASGHYWIWSRVATYCANNGCCTSTSWIWPLNPRWAYQGCTYAGRYYLHWWYRG